MMLQFRAFLIIKPIITCTRARTLEHVCSLRVQKSCSWQTSGRILSVLMKLLNAFPHHMSQEVQVPLQPAWTILVTSCQLYVTSCVNSIQDTRGMEGEDGWLEE